MATTAPAAKKPAKPRAPPAQPKYIDMITTAISALKDRTGSSRQAILRHICANHKVEAAKAAVQVRLALKAGLAKGVLRNARETGKGAGSFKVVKVENPTVKKATMPKKPTAKKPSAKKPATKNHL